MAELGAGARCPWATSDDLYIGYHDDEWGRPVVDDTRLFEKLCLEGFQAGLAWITILRKREAFRSAFAGFDPEVVAAFGEDDVTRLLADAGIVRRPRSRTRRGTRSCARSGARSPRTRGRSSRRPRPLPRARSATCRPPRPSRPR